MPMTAAGRMTALYSAVAANNPNIAKMTDSEQGALKAGMQQFFGADLSYIQSNADVLPATLQAPTTACTVTTSLGPASGTTVAATLTGLGKVS